MPRADGKAIGTNNGRNGVRADQRQGQPVARNHAPGTGKMDGEGVAEGLRLREGGLGDGVKFIDSKFSARVNPKDGFIVADCKEVRARRVLEFLVPLLYSEKPTRVTITVGNTIFKLLSGERLVDWRLVVKDVVQRLFVQMGKSKATPICPFVFHMYHAHEVLLPDEKKEYRMKQTLLKHNVESEGEEDPKDPKDPKEAEDSDESDRESLRSREIREIQKQEFAQMKKFPQNKRGSQAAKEPVVKHKTPTSLERPDRSYQVIAHTLKEIREREHAQEALI